MERASRLMGGGRKSGRLKAQGGRESDGGWAADAGAASAAVAVANTSAEELVPSNNNSSNSIEPNQQ